MVSPLDRLLCWLKGRNTRSWRYRLFDLLDAPLWIGWPPYVRCDGCGRIIDCGEQQAGVRCFDCCYTVPCACGNQLHPDAESCPVCLSVAPGWTRVS